MGKQLRMTTKCIVIIIFSITEIIFSIVDVTFCITENISVVKRWEENKYSLITHTWPWPWGQANKCSQWGPCIPNQLQWKHRLWEWLQDAHLEPERLRNRFNSLANAGDKDCNSGQIQQIIYNKEGCNSFHGELLGKS